MAVKPGLYEYVTAAAMLFIGIVVTVFTIAGIIGLWTAGLGIFVSVIIVFIVVGWLTHELAKILKRNNYL